MIDMIIKHATHYLSDRGLAFFPQWIEQLEKARQTIRGFTQVIAAIDSDNPCKRQVLMFFQDENAFHAWIKAPIHETILAELSRYSQKPWIANTYQIMD